MIIPTELNKNLTNSFQIVNQAINSESCAAQIAEGLRFLGKRAMPKWVYAQGYRPAVRWANFQENYKRWIGAFILTKNQQGADTLLNDLDLWVVLLRKFIGSVKPILDDEKLKELILIRRMFNRMVWIG